MWGPTFLCNPFPTLHAPEATMTLHGFLSYQFLPATANLCPGSVFFSGCLISSQNVTSFLSLVWLSQPSKSLCLSMASFSHIYCLLPVSKEFFDSTNQN